MGRGATVSLFILLAAVYLSPTSGATHECILDSDSTLHTFNQESVRVTPPCRFRMANMTCGDYWVRVTPGMGVWESEAKFSPVTVRVAIRNMDTGDRTTYRISLKDVDKGWTNLDSTSVGLDFDGYNAATDRASLRKTSVLEVEVSLTGSVMVRCHADRFSATSGPDSFCGDGSGEKEIENEAAIHDTLTKEGVVSMVVMLNQEITQSKTCRDLQQYSIGCAGSTFGFEVCGVIIHDPQIAGCLAGSDKPLAQHFSDCIKIACGGSGDPTPLVEANTFIAQNCEGVDMIGPQEVWPTSTTS